MLHATAMLDALPLGVVLWNPEKHLVFANRYILDLLGYGREKAIGTPYHRVLARVCGPLYQGAGRLDRALQGEPVPPFTLQMTHRSGEPVPVEVMLGPWQPEPGPAWAIAALRELQPSPQPALQPVLDALSVAAHELRQPIAGARLLIQALRRDPQRYLNRLADLESELDRWERMMQHLSALSHLAPARLEPVDCPALLTETVRALLPRARRLDVTLDVEPAVPHRPDPWLDREAVRQALLSLADSILETVPERTVIQASCHGSGQEVRFQFRHAGPAADRGMGLAVCRAIVQMQGGRVEVEHGPASAVLVSLVFPRRTHDRRSYLSRQSAADSE